MSSLIPERVLTLTAMAAPVVALAILGLTAFARVRLSERVIGTVVRAAFVTATTALLALALLFSVSGRALARLSLGAWFELPGHRFELILLVDRLSLPFALFTVVLCGVVAGFAHRYLHREPGYNRFFVLLCTFASGMLLIVLAGSVEVAFAGWELVGLSSALLVAFFQERPLPVRNGLRVFIVYRACDVGLLGAAVLLHHFAGSGDYHELFGLRPWPGGTSVLVGGPALWVALLLVLAAMGKCAQIPFSGWLPRAMEGPTPSSAIFYGALSVHAGAYLLLRFAPLLAQAPAARVVLGAVGLLTAVHATLVGRTQTDIKSVLAYASLTQVGIILVEIALGLHTVALVHIVGHASVRSLQFLRAPSLLHDLHRVENEVGGHVAEIGGHHVCRPDGFEARLYRLALDRFHLDELLEAFVARPVLGLFGALDRLERRWTDLLEGRRR